MSRVLDLCRGGKLIEFGCGKGELLRELPKQAYSEYVGFDISDQAITAAKAVAAQAGLRNASFHQSDMAQWSGDSGIALILAEECLYYLKPAEQRVFLMKCCQSLAPTGKLLVVVHDGIKHAHTIELCRSECHVYKEESIRERVYLTLTLKA